MAVRAPHGVVLKIIAINLAVPLFFGAFVREEFVGLFNANLDMGIRERFLFSLRPANFVLIIVFGLLASALVLRILKPLFRYDGGGGAGYGRARRAAIGIPWALMGLHMGLWFLGVTVMYGLVYHWKSPGGIGYLKSLLNSLATGVITGLGSALAINVVLLPVKRELAMTDIRTGERDLFMETKDYFILLAMIANILIFFEHIISFYTFSPSIPPELRHPGVSVLLVGLVYGGFTVLFLYLSRRESHTQFIYMDRRMQDLAKRGGDLTQRVNLVNFDEMGALSAGFNSVLGNLDRLVGQVVGRTDELDAAGKSMAAGMEEVGRALRENGASAENLLEETDSTAREVRGSVEGARRMGDSIRSLDDDVVGQSSAVEESSAAVEQMVANIKRITGTVERMRSDFELLNKVMTESGDRLRDVGLRVREVQEQSGRLDAANLLISRIASETNLLAMNASIEAAHAGVFGHGFSVVADEIRALAENAASQSKRIREELRSTNTLIKAIAEHTEAAEQSTSRMRALAERTDDLDRQVLVALEEQSAGSREVLSALGAIREAGARLKSNAAALREETVIVSAGMNDVERRTEGLARAAERFRVSDAKIRTILEEVQRESGHTQSLIDEITRELGGFTVGDRDTAS